MNSFSEMKSSIDDYSEKKDDNDEINEIDLEELYIGEQIGGGGFAVVYEGEWNGKRVALKTLFDPRVDEKLKREYDNELEIMRKIKHKNIVKLHGACVKPPKLCMIMELCNMSLYDYLHNSTQKFSEKDAMKMFLEIAQALEYLHSQNPSIIHRDIKSQNILLTSSLTVKLCDFGLVNTQHTTAGTPAYMAPELLTNSMFSRKVDVYAFAVVMWETISRTIPFQSWGPRDVRDFVMRGERLKLPYSGCPKVCCKLIERCWDSEYDKRPEFKNIVRALGRIHSTMREVTHTEELQQSGAGDSFDELSFKISKSKESKE